jgi:hypothetical protein
MVFGTPTSAFIVSVRELRTGAKPDGTVCNCVCVVLKLIAMIYPVSFFKSGYKPAEL